MIEEEKRQKDQKKETQELGDSEKEQTILFILNSLLISYNLLVMFSKLLRNLMYKRKLEKQKTGKVTLLNQMKQRESYLINC